MISSLKRLLVGLAISVWFSPASTAEEVQNGPVYVENSSTPIEPPVVLELEELWRIGGYGDRDEDVFGLIMQVLCDDDSNVYIVDNKLSTVKMYSPQGEFIGVIGREGDGPGDIRSPVSAFLLPGNEIGILCRQGIRRFTRDGDPKGSYPFPEHRLPSSLSRARMMRDGLVFCRVVMDRHKTGYEATTYIGKSDHNAREIARFTQRTISRSYANFVLQEDQTNDWQTRWEVGPDDRLYVSPEFREYQIQVWSPDGTLERIIRREYEPLKRNEEELAKARKPWEAAVRLRRGARAEVSPIHRAIIHLFPRSDGTLWVLSSRGAREVEVGQLARFDVFGRDGRFLRQVVLEGHGDALRDQMFFSENRVFVVVGDSEDEVQDIAPNTILCYRIEAVN